MCECVSESISKMFRTVETGEEDSFQIQDSPAHSALMNAVKFQKP